MKASRDIERIYLGRGKKEIQREARSWWLMSLIPALRRQRQADLSEFEISLT